MKLHTEFLNHSAHKHFTEILVKQEAGYLFLILRKLNILPLMSDVKHIHQNGNEFCILISRRNEYTKACLQQWKRWLTDLFLPISSH